MRYYKDVRVAGTASIESLSTLLTGTTKEPKHVDAIRFIEDTTTAQLDAQLRAYLNLEKFIDMNYEMLLAKRQYEAMPGADWLEVDIDLGAGDELKVGHVSGGTASHMRIAVRYTIG